MSARDMEHEIKRKTGSILVYSSESRETDGEGKLRAYSRNSLSYLLDMSLSDVDRMIRNGDITGIYVVGSNGIKREFYLHPRYKFMISDYGTK